MRVVLHVPQVAELMLGAGDRPAGARGLHREAGDHERDREPASRFQIAGADAVRVGHPASSRDCTMSQISAVDRVDAQRVGQNPIEPGRAFRDEVGVAGGVQAFRRGGDDFQIGNHAERRGQSNVCFEPSCVIDAPNAV